MSNLLVLTSEEFRLERASKGGLIMCTSLPNLSLVLFYATGCDYCKPLIPIFKRLPGRIDGVSFGIVNVTQNKPVIGMAAKTIAPIKYVPYIMMYVNNKPYMQYDREPTEQGILQFIMHVNKSLQVSRQFSQNGNPQSSESQSSGPQREDPESAELKMYCLGVPVSGDKTKQVCYLSMAEFLDNRRT